MKLELARRVDDASAGDEDAFGDVTTVSSVKQSSGVDESWFSGFSSIFSAEPVNQEERHDGPLPDSNEVIQGRDRPPSPSEQSPIERTMDFLHANWSGSEKIQESSLKKSDSPNQENPPSLSEVGDDSDESSYEYLMMLDVDSSPQNPIDDVSTDVPKKEDDNVPTDVPKKKDINASPEDPDDSPVGCTSIEAIIRLPKKPSKKKKRRGWFSRKVKFSNDVTSGVADESREVRKVKFPNDATSGVVDESRDEKVLVLHHVESQSNSASLSEKQDESTGNVDPKEEISMRSMGKSSTEGSEVQDPKEEITMQAMDKSSTERSEIQDGIIRTASEAFDNFASECTLIPTRSKKNEEHWVVKSIDVIAFPEEHCIRGAASDNEDESQVPGCCDVPDDLLRDGEAHGYNPDVLDVMCTRTERVVCGTEEEALWDLMQSNDEADDGNNNHIFKNPTFESLTCAERMSGRDRVVFHNFGVGKQALRCDNSLLGADESESSDESQNGTKPVSTIPVILVNRRRKSSRFSIFGRKSGGKSYRKFGLKRRSKAEF